MPHRVAVLALLTALASPGLAQCATQWQPGGGIPGLAGAGFAMTWWDPDGPGPIPDRLVIAGRFATAFSVEANNIVAWDPATDTWSTFGAGLNDEVRALAVMPNGDLVAAGEFTQAGGQPASLIARWDGSTWSPLGSGLVGGVFASVWGLAVLPNGGLVAGGVFDTAGGVPADKVARWNGASWSPLGAGVPGQFTGVDDVAVLPGGDVVICGTLDTVPGPMRYLRRWDGTSWTAVGGGPDGYVNDLLVLPNGDLLISGQFQNAGGVPASGVARWDGALWSALGAGVGGNSAITMTPLGNGDLFVGGSFLSAGGMPAMGAATWNGTSWTVLGDDAGIIVYAATELPDGRLLAVGTEWHTGPFTWRAQVWDGQQWSFFGAGFNAAIEAVAVLGTGDVVAGGSFVHAGGVAANHVARRDGATGTWSALGSGTDDVVRAVTEQHDGGVVVAGDFTAAGGAPASRIARWDDVSGSWSPLGQGLSDSVRDLVTLHDGDVIAVGRFLQAGGSQSPFIARWDGTSWSNLGSWPNWYVEAVVEMQSGDLVVGGGFGSAGGVTCRRIARWDGTSWSPLGAGFTPWVRALAVMPNGDVVAGGDDGFVARWNGATWTSLGGGMNRDVLALEVLPNGDLLAGGEFGVTGGPPGSGLARWSAATGTWSPVAGGVSGYAHDFAFGRDGVLNVGGSFLRAGGELSAYFARLESTCPAGVDPIATACVGPIGPVTLTPDNLPFAGSTFRSTATGFLPNAIAVSLLGLSSPNVHLSWLWSGALPSCDQLASHEAILLSFPPAGVATYAFAIPNDPVFAGLALFHQFLHFEVDVQNQLGSLSCSNGLRLTIGAF